jgi:hypothetical protein
MGGGKSDDSRPSNSRPAPSRNAPGPDEEIPF